MSDHLLKLFRRCGDAHVGQTLTRLARLATAAHRYENALQLSNNESSLHKDKELHQTQHADTSQIVHPSRTDAGVIHREVDR